MKKEKQISTSFSIANQHFLDFMTNSFLILPFFGTAETSRVVLSQATAVDTFLVLVYMVQRHG